LQAICFEPSFHFLEIKGFFLPPLSDDSEIVRVLKEFPILSNGEYNRRLSSPFIDKELLLECPHCHPP
jgi:hypothetical protein